MIESQDSILSKLHFLISNILEELYKLLQCTLDVLDYFTKMKVLWDELGIIISYLVTNARFNIATMLLCIHKSTVIKTMSYAFLKASMRSLVPPNLRLCLWLLYWALELFSHGFSARKITCYSSSWSPSLWCIWPIFHPNNFLANTYQDKS